MFGWREGFRGWYPFMTPMVTIDDSDNCFEMRTNILANGDISPTHDVQQYNIKILNGCTGQKQRLR